MRQSISSIGSLLATVLLASSPSVPAADAVRPVLLYSRHFNAAGESRYLHDGTYRGILHRLSQEFEVRVNDQSLNRESLQGIQVVLVANPSDKAVGTNPPPHHFNDADIAALDGFVTDGGGLIVLGNQENHNLEIEDTNRLLARFGLQFTNVYTDAKQIVLSVRVPLFGGLKWAYYTGNQVQFLPGHPARPQALISNDLSQKPFAGTRDARGALMASAEPGHGRVVVVTDAGWLTDDALSGRGIGGVAIKDQDNFEIARRLMHWAAHTVAPPPSPKNRN
jgi:hypothetical protein